MISRRVAGAIAVAVVAPLTFAAVPAQATQTRASSITAVPDNDKPASGQTFHVNGLFLDQGKPANHEVVKIQALEAGNWVQLTGAQMLTRSDGTYTMRLVLQAKGERELRAVGIVPGPARDAFKRFEVTVH